MHIYKYSGPVSYYDRVIASNWKAETRAESEAKAVNNLKYQFKKDASMLPTIGGIKLSGKLTIM